MAKAKRNRAASDEIEGAEVSAQEKIARLLGLLLVKDLKTKGGQVPLLRVAGFSVAQVAAMLGMSEASVRQTDYESRKKRKDS